jgi:hypothetical protein
VVVDEWISPVVDASKGNLRTMLGKMNWGRAQNMRSTGRIPMRPNSEEAKECGDGARETEFGKTDREGEVNPGRYNANTCFT